jgi:UDP-N-acetylglucosamine:LPS N-acetylglucosamine transferase
MKNKKVLAIASGGGHWKQLMLLRDAFINCDVLYVTTIEGLPEQSGIKKFTYVKDSNQNDKLAVLYSMLQLFFIFLKTRPNVVITTGASPGVLAIALGRLFGSKTIWVDSIANSEKLSMGGNISRKISHKIVTQWQHLEDGNKVYYNVSVF